MTRTTLSITCVPMTTVVMLSLRGEIDMSNVEALESELTAALAQTSRRMAVDLSGVSFCDSLGFSALIRCWRAANDSGREFVLSRPSPAVRRILAMMGIDTVIAIIDDPTVVDDPAPRNTDR